MYMVTAAMTTAAHPLVLYSMQPYGDDETPLTYGSPPSASQVPGNPGCYGSPNGMTCSLSQKRAVHTPKRDVSKDLSNQLSSASTTLPIHASLTEAVVSSSTCRSIMNASPTTTIPSFCHPSLHVNAPSLNRSRFLPTATATISAVADKLSCCVECAGVLNCAAWSFQPVYTQPPSPRVPGGFDPWGRGNCAVLYNIGDPDAQVGGGTEDAAAVCPNGKIGDMLEGSNNRGKDDGEGGHELGKKCRWDNLFYNGWNQGTCGEPQDEWKYGTDPGVGDTDSLCPA
ncbi:hypothetical protein BJ170DRAFT_416495 [Xylariales sp. AK1849]|nr:hypothetical protein BJ170DRAFT_416495 [Xylariales sp. AK1849]